MTIRFSAVAVAVAAVFSANSSLAAVDVQGKAVVVTATRTSTPVNELLSDLTVIDREDIERAGQSTLAEFLAGFTGVQYSQAGGTGASTSIYLRGGAAGHTLILIDGMRTGSATLGEPNPQSIPLQQVERIEILRGPASALYGSDAIGGVIQVFTRRGERGAPRAEAFVGAGSYGFREGAVGISGGDQRWTYRLSGGYSESDGFSSRHKSVADPDNDGHRGSNASGHFALIPLSGHELGLSFLYAKNRTWYDDQFSSKPADIRRDSEVSTLRVYSQNRISDQWETTLSFGRSLDDSDDRFSALSPESHFQTVQDLTSWQNVFRLPFGRVLLAYEYLTQKVDTGQEIASDSRSVSSLLAGWQGTFGQSRLQANIRHDDNSSYGQQATGSLAYGYQLSKEWRVHASYGTSFAAPTFNDLYWPESVFVCTVAICGIDMTYIERGNLSVKPEEGRNREIALYWEGAAVSGSITYFNNKVRNLIDWQKSVPAAGVELFMPSNVSSARLEGVSLSGESNVNQWRASANIDFLRARDEETGDRLQRRADRSATLRLSRTLGDLSAGAELIANGARYSTNGNRDKMAGYAIMNVFAEYAIDSAWTVEGRINNLFDRKYELIKDFNTSGVNIFVGLRYVPK